VACLVTMLGAAGGLLVALSIKYGDAILKTLATTTAIILSSFLDWSFLNGPLTPIMMIAAVQVILAVSNYTFDSTPEHAASTGADSSGKELSKDSDRPIRRIDEEIALSEQQRQRK
jgi:solute carrier family 35 (UDP-sugar transporter), member A1/2/3